MLQVTFPHPVGAHTSHLNHTRIQITLIDCCCVHPCCSSVLVFVVLVPVTHFHRLFTWFVCTEIWHLMLGCKADFFLTWGQTSNTLLLAAALAISCEQLNWACICEQHTGNWPVILNKSRRAIVFCWQIGYWHYCHCLMCVLLQVCTHTSAVQSSFSPLLLFSWIVCEQ